MNILITTPSFAIHGGIRIILEWCNRLSERHCVTLYCASGETQCSWFIISNKVQVTSNYTTGNIDCLIITSPHTIHLADRTDCPKKVFLFMQMCEHLFRPNDKAWQALCKKFYTSRHPIIHGSHWGEEMLRRDFKRTGEMYYVGNGVNAIDFPITQGLNRGNNKTILVEGWESLNPAKDTDHIAPQVAKKLKQEGYYIIAYAQLPLKTMPEAVNEYYYAPSTEKMNELYKRATLLLKASKYDARALAPMEAMTKGMVTARAIIKGDDDLINGVNCLRCNYNVHDLYRIAKQLLTNNKLRMELSENCINYVQQYSWIFWMQKVNEIIEGDEPYSYIINDKAGNDKAVVPIVPNVPVKLQQSSLINDKVKTIIISIEYNEQEWQQTKQQIEACNAPVVYVNRNGTGSLAKAINDGFKHAGQQYNFEYAWIVTNINFNPALLPALEEQMDNTGFAAIHPAFNSDHIHARTTFSTGLKPAPFIEFTAPIVRREVFEKFMLDENMPYWGHDLDWGYRVNKAGHTIGVDYTNTIEHTYIRNNKGSHPSTIKRLQLRRQADRSTIEALRNKYGHEWRSIVFPKTENEIVNFYEQVKKQISV